MRNPGSIAATCLSRLSMSRWGGRAPVGFESDITDVMIPMDEEREDEKVPGVVRSDTPDEGEVPGVERADTPDVGGDPGVVRTDTPDVEGFLGVVLTGSPVMVISADELVGGLVEDEE